MPFTSLLCLHNSYKDESIKKHKVASLTIVTQNSIDKTSSQKSSSNFPDLSYGLTRNNTVLVKTAPVIARPVITNGTK